MTGRAHEGVDSSVGSVRSSSHLRSSVHLDVFDNEGIYFKTLVIATIRSEYDVKVQNITR